MNESERFSTRLRNWLAKLHLTQEKGRVLLGIGRSYLSQLINGREPGATLAARLGQLEQLSSEQIQRELVNKSGYEADEPPAPRLIETPPDYSPRAKLRAALKAKGLSPAQLAKRMGGYNAEIIDNIVNGTGRISEVTAEKMAAELDGEVTKEELLEGSETPTIIDPLGFMGTYGKKPTAPGRQWAPKIAWAAAGNLKNAGALDEAWDGTAVDTDVKGRIFSVDIEGDSMYPEVNPGDTAIVRVDVEARPGQLVLVRTIHGDVWCKRYTTKDGNRFAVFSSVNDTYKPIEIPMGDIAWIYPVKQVIRNY